jgi:trans-2,3-dihydro-3-hydroxyanthranilate isomerase
MKSRIFYIVDVFAEKKYAGNQLAVFRNTENLSGDEMQKIAKEMNYSETTFIISEEEHKGGYDVRIFTPANELPFAGHPTLGTAFIIQREILKQPVPKVILNLKVGQITVSFEYGEEPGDSPEILFMKHKPPVYGPVFEREEMAAVLNLSLEDFDMRFPIQEVSTGMPSVIVPLVNLNALKKAHVSRDEYFEFVNKTEGKAILIFCPEAYTSEDALGVRMFADYYGVPEDPATGSSNGCLAAYLVEHRYFGEEDIDICVGQGYEIGRPSRLYLRSARKEKEIEVQVGGKVIPIASGSFYE